MFGIVNRGLPPEAGAGGASLSLSCVFRQKRVVFQHGEGVVVDIFSGCVCFAENLLEVLVSDCGEMRTVLRRNAQHDRVRGQCFALAHGHVFGKLVHHAVHGKPGFTAVGQRRVGGAAICTGGHAEGGVTRCAVGGGSQKVGWSSTLAFEQHVAPAAIRAAWRLGHGVEGCDGEESTKKNPFHSFSLFCDQPRVKVPGRSLRQGKPELL
jgi:hypothetical protein